MVSIQAQTISKATPHLTADNLFKEPIPNIAPVIVCVVLTGIPNPDAIKRVMAALVSAQKPSTGLSFANFIPIVLTIRQPPNIVPRAIVA